MCEEFLQVPALKDFIIRPPKMEDAQACTDLSNIFSQKTWGTNQQEAVDFEFGWQAPGVDLERSVRLVFTEGGQLVGYFAVRDHNEPYVRIGVSVVIHPDYQESEMPAAMFAWAEAVARLAISKAPVGAQVALSSGTSSLNTWKKDFLESQGLEVVRHFLRMEIKFDGVPQEPDIPKGLVIRPYDPETELEQVALAYQDSFQDHFGYVEEPLDTMMEELVHWIANDPDHDPEVWFIAMDGDRIAGLSICTPRIVEDVEMGYVYILGVGRDWRGRGLGQALLRHSFVELYKKGCQRVGLDVDASSLTGAIRLYKKAGMSVTRQGDSYRKILREGEDISTTSL